MSATRILTTHVGSLPRPQHLLDMYVADELPASYGESLRKAVAGIVDQQVQAGIDIVNDGEFGKRTQTNGPGYGHLTWALYVHDRLDGFELAEGKEMFRSSRDRSTFKSFYGEQLFPGTDRKTIKLWTCTGPVKYSGHAAVQRDIENLKAAMEASGATRAFLPVVSPATVAGAAPNRYYATAREYELALAEAMAEEYAAIAAAGIEVQIDDPGLVVNWDMTDQAVDEYRKTAIESVELLNHALSGIDREVVRYHLCWGGWLGPHSTDLPLADIIDVMLGIEAGAYSFEAANPRHEHEWRVWEDVRLPDDTKLIPGVVTHKSAVLEHPELVADRLVRFAQIVGSENVIAAPDCGLGGRIDPELGWAKLASLVEGAALATARMQRARRLTTTA